MGEYAEYEIELSTHHPGDSPMYEPVEHLLTASMRLYLSDDRHNLNPTVSAYYNQSYVLRMRFEARQSGWSFDETLRFTEVLPKKGYYGLHTFERAVSFKGAETLHITTVQADWLGVTFDDWRYLHGVIWSLSLCGAVPSPSASSTPLLTATPLAPSPLTARSIARAGASAVSEPTSRTV